MVIIPFLLALGKNKLKKQSEQKFMLWLIIIFLTIISGFRSTSVGRDSLGYATNFLNQSLEWYEPAFILLQKILYKIWPNYTFFFTFMAFFTNYFFVMRLNDFDELGAKLHWSIFFFTMTSFSVGFNGMRQWLSVALCFYATRFLFCESGIKLVKYVLFTSVAISFHNSAIISIILVLPVVLNRKRDVKVAIMRVVGLIGFLIIMVNGTEMLEIDRYGNILNSEEANFEFGYMSIVKYFVLIMLIIDRQIQKANGNNVGLISNNGAIKLSYDMFLAVEFLYISLASLSYWFGTIARIAWYFEVFETLIFAHVFTKKSNSAFIGFSRLLLIVIALAKFNGNFSITELRFPYLFFWQ